MANEILTPEEWVQTQGHWDTTHWLILMKSYAEYYASERLKQSIKLPEYGDFVSTDYTEGYNEAIDETKRLNGLDK